MLALVHRRHSLWERWMPHLDWSRCCTRWSRLVRRRTRLLDRPELLGHWLRREWLYQARCGDWKRCLLHELLRTVNVSWPSIPRLWHPRKLRLRRDLDSRGCPHLHRRQSVPRLERMQQRGLVPWQELLWRLSHSRLVLNQREVKRIGPQALLSVYRVQRRQNLRWIRLLQRQEWMPKEKQ